MRSIAKLLAIALIVATLAALVAVAAGPADSPAAYTFTADGGIRIATGANGPSPVYVRCGSGTATISFFWDNGRVAPVPANGTASAYPLVGDGVWLDQFEFAYDGPDSMYVDLGTAAKLDALW